MNELCLDLEQCAPWLLRRGRRPAPVRDFQARCGTHRILLEWSPPRGSRVAGYRIDRTREGRDYECVAETSLTSHFIVPPPVDDPWFYRVTPFNERGDGGFRLVWFVYHQRGKHIQLTPIAVRPGRRVNIYDLERS